MENSKIKTLLLDGYLDEPSCLGVPPYIAPHIRYTYGALREAGIREDNLTYKTIDQLREKGEEKIAWMEEFDLIIIIAGTTVPGHYLGGKPISLTEIKEIGETLYYPQKVLGGPVTLVHRNIPGFDHICGEIAALDLYQILEKDSRPAAEPEEIAAKIASWARTGAELTARHPSYPHLVCEIETFRGCPRTGHCRFCSERLKNIKYQRKAGDIIAEINALAAAGNHYYRLGCQTDLLSFQAERKGKELLPNPGAIHRLYSGIRKADPDLKVLHLDNINPTTVINHRQRSEEILQTICNYNTTGDVAAFGLESADPAVLSKNNIACDPETAYRAVEIVNRIGGRREKGIPVLLPGINFLHGLVGEREATMDYNLEFLHRLLAAGLLLRRINIRQVFTLGEYPEVPINQGKFREYKQRVNEEINKPMLEKVFPTGTVMENVFTETRRGRLTYGRQPGSYPILVGIPGKLDLNQFITVRVIDHGYRSITALPWPFNVKQASVEQLTYIPGIGRNRANKIFINRPGNHRELRQLLGNNFPYERWRDWFNFQ